MIVTVDGSGTVPLALAENGENATEVGVAEHFSPLTTPDIAATGISVSAGADMQARSAATTSV